MLLIENKGETPNAQCPTRLRPLGRLRRGGRATFSVRTPKRRTSNTERPIEEEEKENVQRSIYSAVAGSPRDESVRLADTRGARTPAGRQRASQTKV